jgi:hypothetical protein
MPKGQITQSTKTVVTYSSMSMFLTCRRKYQHRIINKLESKNRSKALSFGGLIHDCLKIHHTAQIEKNQTEIEFAQDAIQLKLENEIEAHFSNPNGAELTHKQKEEKCKAIAMITCYADTYTDEPFFVHSIEGLLQGPILNPATNRSRRGLTYAGAYDGLVYKIVKGKPVYFLFEHKTAAQLSKSYLERLIGDLQIVLYSVYLEMILGIKIEGVIYNVLVKHKIQMSEGETEEEFEMRRDALIAKSKTGKTSAKRKEPETEEAFLCRLIDKYSSAGKGDFFHREEIIFNEAQKAECREEIWNITGYMQEAYRDINKGSFYKNRTACNAYNRLCKYWQLCNGCDDEISRKMFFNVVEPHQELRLHENYNDGSGGVSGDGGDGEDGKASETDKEDETAELERLKQMLF